MSKMIMLILFLVIVPLSILGYISIKDSQDMGIKASEKAQDIGNLTLAKSTDAITTIAGDSFVRLGRSISEDVVYFLAERERDALLASHLTKGSVGSIESFFMDFMDSKQALIWYNLGSDLEPVEKKEMIPIYNEISFIGLDGLEVVRIKDGRPDVLRDVSVPENTEFKNEDYFAKALDTSKGEVYVSRVNTWYLSTEQARKDLPENLKDNADWNILPLRDVMKSGNMRFAAPVYDGDVLKGVVVLSMDYRHLQELTKHIDPASETRVVSTPYEDNYILFFDDLGDTIVHPKPNNIRGYLEDGSLEHPNTVANPGGIFNLKEYDKSKAYKEMYDAVLDKQTLVTSAIDVKGRRKMTVTVPIPYDSGEYRDSGLFGGIMLSVNTDKYYESVISTEAYIKDEIETVKKDINDSTKKTMRNMIVVTLLTIFVGIILGVIFSNGIVNPLRRLTVAGARVADGELDTDMPDVKSKDEIEDLKDTMSLLIGAVKFFKKNQK